MNNIPNLLLAAGASRRMGTPKQLLPWRGKTLIEHQIETLLKTDQEVYVVLGAHAERILPVLKPYPVNPIIFEQWSLGMGNTIAFSVAYLIKKQGSMDGILIALTDQPLVTPHITTHFSMPFKKKNNNSSSQSLTKVGRVFQHFLTSIIFRNYST